jgi:hypothetical protein
MWALVRIEQVSARNSSHRRHYELPPLIGLRSQCLHQSRAYRIISLSSMYCGRSGLCASRKGHLTISCAPALRAPVVEVQTAQPRSRLPMIFDGWFRRYASLHLERFDFSRLAVVPNLLLVCYTNCEAALRPRRIIWSKGRQMWICQGAPNPARS